MSEERVGERGGSSGMGGVDARQGLSGSPSILLRVNAPSSLHVSLLDTRCASPPPRASTCAHSSLMETTATSMRHPTPRLSSSHTSMLAAADLSAHLAGYTTPRRSKMMRSPLPLLGHRDRCRAAA